ncbi:MAG: COX15/CtaA family protein [Candidatus Acidiferrales bacterium]
MLSSHNPRVHSFAIFTACSTLVLLMAGALVTSNDAGLSVPDWPLSYGSWMPPMVGGIFYEHGHRMIAAFVGCLSIILAVWLWRADHRRWVRWLGVTALGLVIAQGVLGGVTVRYFLPPAVSSAHATLAQLFFITVISIAMFTSKWWRSDLPELEDSGSPALRSLVVCTTAVIIVQLFLGAAFRHNALGIQPHLVGAVVVAVMVVLTSRAVRKRFPLVKDLRRCGQWLNIFFGIQILLGIAAYWVTIAYHDAPQPMPLFVTVTVAHVLGGALTLAASFVLTLTTFRLMRRRGAAVESHPEGARI